MKPVKILLVTVAIFFINSAYAAQYKFIAKDNSKDTKMCVLAGNNEIEPLKKAVKYNKTWSSYKESEKSLVNRVYCNNLHIANFAKKYNANETFDYLKKYTRKHNLDKLPTVTIKDVVARTSVNKSAEEIIIVYVGR
ncbi:DUF3718 domain-containing protein [Paraglaciecola sp. MB-3u-78]|jgi:hypothetical protein|uniref:DUF3718 domain-containing protein n=1 Tax=Paraglaciecola sp. MB-3u-78 TaxID=2058332 RepID=UPI000C3274B1|nr:DUF3718 domain-containing protein [Paraglaciecola sp. MB-3u-78]PKG99135.1 hypothetical protein CXF95_07510 [Paraglaciecola sp. MB-3u-78]